MIRTNVPEERMSAADVVLTYKIGTGREGVPGDQGVRPPDPAHPPPPRIRAHLLICMLAHYVDMHMRKALAPMLFDDERGPVLNSPVAKAEGNHKAHELRTGRPRLPRTACATRNTDDEPDRALGARKAGTRRPRLADADPGSGTKAAEREDSHTPAPRKQRLQ